MPRANVSVYDLCNKRTGPHGISYACSFCSHYEFFPRGRGRGQGYGFAEGGKARGRAVQHAKSAHPQEYAKLKQAALDRINNLFKQEAA